VVRTDRWGRVVGEWAQRLNPDGPVGATHVHGITDADVAGAPRFGDILPQLNSWLGAAVVVAHNAAFDLAFLRAEYAYQGWVMPWLPALCTLEASDYYLPALERRRLSDCCCAVRIRLDGAHSALGDARAAAALLAHYLNPHAVRPARPADLDLLRQAATVHWPTGPTRRPQTPTSRASVMPRIRAKAPTVARPNLAELVADFSLADALDEGATPGSMAYLEKLAGALEDGVLTDEEATVLHDIAAAYHLSAEDCAGAHRAFILTLCHLALDDGRVSQAERAELRSMAALLGQPDGLVIHALDQAEAARNARLSADLQPLPDDWKYGDPLRVGDKVVFTGCDEQLRQRLETRTEQLGVRVMNAVSRKTTLLVTDGTFTGTKAAAAQQLRIRAVHPDLFDILLRHLQPALPRPRSRSSQAGASNPNASTAGPVTPDPTGQTTMADPALVRQWARANGYEVGDRGRLPREVLDSYNSTLTGRAHEPA